LKIVDTTFLISLLRDDPGTIKKAEELDNEGGAATTVINIYETMYGVYRTLSNREERLASLQRLITNLEVLGLDYEATCKAAEISGNLQRAGNPIDPFDALIAGITLQNGAEALVTRNTRHFTRIPELTIEEH
jgi:predicted nucleic acid-binding protein